MSAVESLQHRIREAKNIFTPSRFEILDNLEVTLENLLSSKLSSSLGIEFLESRLREANGKINRLTSHIQHLLSEKEQLLFDMDDHRQSIRNLAREAADAKKKISQLENEKLKSDTNLGQAIDTLENQREYVKRLQAKTRSLESTIERLKSILEKKDKELEELKKQFTESIKEKLSGLDVEQSQRVLQGRFIGNVSTKSKFHFDFDCPDFWTWVGRYLCSSDPNIISSESPKTFHEAGLEPCSKCAKKI